MDKNNSWNLRQILVVAAYCLVEVVFTVLKNFVL